MTETTLSSIGLAYRWILSYYEDVAQFCRRVRGELGERGYVQYASTDSIEVRSSRSLGLTNHWLPCYHYQLFRSQVPDAPGFESDRVALLCVGIDHFDPATPDRAEPVVYLARFGPVRSDELGDLKYGIVVSARP